MSLAASDMPAVMHLVTHNQRLSESELLVAKAICQDTVRMVKDRDLAVRNKQVDIRFALPDANWSYDAPNEYVRVFRRLSECDPSDMMHFRGFTQVFSGYNLYQVLPGEGLTTSNLTFDEDFDRGVAERLQARNWSFVEEWHRQTQGLSRQFVFCPPAKLGEVGYDIGGVIVNSDTCTYQERVNSIVQSGLMSWLMSRIEAAGEVRICEVGGGYGALCHWFKSALPEASYTIVDLPESLLFSRLYTTLTRPDLCSVAGLEQTKYGVRFVPNYLADSLNEEFDLLINTLSMSEMSEYQVRKYVDIMKNVWLRNGGMFFEQNHDNRHLGFLFAQDIIATEFIFRTKLFDENTGFRNGKPNIWSMHPIELEAPGGRPRGVPIPMLSP
jgi:hypothetical protein